MLLIIVTFYIDQNSNGSFPSTQFLDPPPPINLVRGPHM